jgi:hypothetical protein
MPWYSISCWVISKPKINIPLDLTIIGGVISVLKSPQSSSLCLKPIPGIPLLASRIFSEIKEKKHGFFTEKF